MKARSYQAIAFFSLLFHLALPSAAEAAENPVVHIAITAPRNSMAGNSIIRGAQLYLDHYNRAAKGGSARIIMDIHDDGNDSKQAQSVARKIAEGKKAVAVIGHVSSSISISAGKIYKELKIPAISPCSTSDRVTRENDWYFTTVFNNSIQGRFLAYYVKNILKRKRVCIIREDPEHSSGIAEVFMKVAGKVGLSVEYNRMFHVENPGLDKDLDRMVLELKKRMGKSAIFLGAHPAEGVLILKKIRDAGIKNPVIGPTSFASKAFKSGFDKFDRDEPGRYTNGLYVGVPLIFDTANGEAQNFRRLYQDTYGEDPDWRAAFAYDTAKILAEAIEKTGVTGKQANLAKDRITIKEYLKTISHMDRAIAGTSGPTYFSREGFSQKPMTMGRYRNRNIISAPIQLRPVRRINLVPNLEEAVRQGEILKFDGQYVHKTNVVYAGVDIGSIREVNFRKGTSLIDFHIWFRYHGDLEAQNILFENAESPIMLSPSAEGNLMGMEKESKTYATLIREESAGELTSRLYHVKAWFRADFVPDRKKQLESHLLGFRFRHRELTREKLIYVTDVLGMGLTGGLTYKDLMERNGTLKTLQGWGISGVRFFQDTSLKSSMGNLMYLDVQDKFQECSRFNFQVLLGRQSLSLRRKIPYDEAMILTAASTALLLLFLALRYRKSHVPFAGILIIARMIATTILLLSSEILLISYMDSLGPRFSSLTVRAMNILWWIVPAIYIHLALTPFVWNPMEKQTGRPTPRVMRRLPAYLIYLITAYGIAVYELELNITRFMATSGALAMAAGYLVKDNISNFLASISIIHGYEVRMGQWVQISGHDEGQVEEITKQVTRIRTRDGALLNIPNTMVVGSILKNFGDPEATCWLCLTVDTEEKDSSSHILEILSNAVLSTDEILKNPEPIILFEGYTDVSARYTARFAIKDYGKKNDLLAAAWQNILSHLEMAGVHLAVPPKLTHLSSSEEFLSEEIA